VIEAFLICPDLIEAVEPYPNALYFTQMFLILPKTLLKFFSWPKFDEGCWNYHMIPVHSRAVFILPSGAKKNGKIVSDYLCPNKWPIARIIVNYAYGHWSAFLVSLKSKMQSARIFVSSNVEELRNHSVTFSVSKTDFTCRLRQRRPKHNPCWYTFDLKVIYVVHRYQKRLRLDLLLSH